jgi:hypothetical protein
VNSACATHPAMSPARSPRACQTGNDLTLVALHTAIRLSGLFAKFTAQHWGLHHLSHAAERVATELVTRAVETTGNPDPHPATPNLANYTSSASASAPTAAAYSSKSGTAIPLRHLISMATYRPSPKSPNNGAATPSTVEKSSGHNSAAYPSTKPNHYRNAPQVNIPTRRPIRR